MQEILSLIKVHQDLIGKYHLSEEERIPYIRDLVLAAHVELTEFLQELPWKPWKREEDQKNNIHRAEDELIDAFIFLLDIWTVLNVNSDLEHEINRTITNNIDRILNKDHKQHV